MLIFDDTGTCIKEIGGAAVPGVGEIGFPRPDWAHPDLPLTAFRLVRGEEVRVIPMSLDERARALETGRRHSAALDRMKQAAAQEIAALLERMARREHGEDPGTN